MESMTLGKSADRTMEFRRDTVMDMTNYAIMIIIELENET